MSSKRWSGKLLLWILALIVLGGAGVFTGPLVKYRSVDITESGVRKQYRVFRWGQDQGQKHGEYTETREDGTIRSKGSYEQGVPVGMWQIFGTAGTLMFQGVFESGKPREADLARWFQHCYGQEHVRTVDFPLQTKKRRLPPQPGNWQWGRPRLFDWFPGPRYVDVLAVTIIPKDENGKDVRLSASTTGTPARRNWAYQVLRINDKSRDERHESPWYSLSDARRFVELELEKRARDAEQD